MHYLLQQMYMCWKSQIKVLNVHPLA